MHILKKKTQSIFDRAQLSSITRVETTVSNWTIWKIFYIITAVEQINENFKFGSSNYASCRACGWVGNANILPVYEQVRVFPIHSRVRITTYLHFGYVLETSAWGKNKTFGDSYVRNIENYSRELVLPK